MILLPRNVISTSLFFLLTTLPLAEFNYNLNKEQFWDALRLRYNWNIPRTPTECACGSKFTVQHALSCKKGGFITLRHNEVRDITAEVCKDVRKEPLLTKLTGENIDEKTTKIGDEATGPAKWFSKRGGQIVSFLKNVGHHGWPTKKLFGSTLP